MSDEFGAEKPEGILRFLGCMFIMGSKIEAIGFSQKPCQYFIGLAEF